MISEKLPVAAELLDRVPECFEFGGALDVGRFSTDLRKYLGEDRTAETVLPVAEIDQEENCILIRFRLGRTLWVSRRLGGDASPYLQLRCER